MASVQFRDMLPADVKGVTVQLAYQSWTCENLYEVAPSLVLGMTEFYLGGDGSAALESPAIRGWPHLREALDHDEMGETVVECVRTE